MMRRANEPGRGNEDKKRRVDGGEGGEGGFAGKYFFLVPVEVKKVAAPVIIKRTVWVGAQRLCQSVSWGCN